MYKPILNKANSSRPDRSQNLASSSTMNTTTTRKAASRKLSKASTIPNAVETLNQTTQGLGQLFKRRNINVEPLLDNDSVSPPRAKKVQKAQFLNIDSHSTAGELPNIFTNTSSHSTRASPNSNRLSLSIPIDRIKNDNNYSTSPLNVRHHRPESGTSSYRSN